MAIAQGKTISDSIESIKYIGIAPILVRGVNPNREELHKFFGREFENEPEYLSTTEIEVEGNKKKVNQIRLDFLIEVENPSIKHRMSFFLTEELRYNKDRTKIQMINKYGECAWLPIENAKNKTVPENMNWFDSFDIRPTYIGEEDLISFIKAYLNIPNKSYTNRTTGEVVMLENLSEAEARLDEIKLYFKGDIKELKKVITFQPNNKVKALFGVRQTDKGIFQTIYTKLFVKNFNSNYATLENSVNNTQSMGGYNNTIFEICELKEYKAELPKEDNPLESGVSSGWDEL